MDDPQTEDFATEERTWTVNPGWSCPSCGFKNSPYLGLHPLTEFSITPTVPAKFTLLSIEDQNGQRHHVSFGAHHVQAHTPSGLREGMALLDWKLIFEDDKGNEIPVKILGYAKYPDWTGNAMIDTYSLGYREANDGPYINVCPGLSFEDTTIVFTPGEIYVDETKKVIPGQRAFVTVACQGHAVAKLKFLGHDPNDNYGSAPENRQAALKMLTADYCGDGKSHTTFGQPLDWQDELGLFSLTWTPKIEDLEARWDEHGAVCLNEPRNAAVDRSKIGCSIAWCGDPADDLDGNLWATYHAP